MPKGKHPVQAGWAAAATEDLAVLDRWPTPPYNRGIVTGDGFVVLDFDGEEGLRTLERLVVLFPEMEQGWVQRTGSGGVHVGFAVEGRVKNAVRVLPGMDVRGDGGMVVVAPSVHRSGGRYEVLHDPPEIPILPDGITAILRGDVPREFQSNVDLEEVRDWAATAKTQRRAWKAVLAGEPWAAHGSRETTLFRMCSALAKRWPAGAPDALARVFAESFAALAAEDPESKTAALGLRGAEDRIHRCQEALRVEEIERPTIVIGPEDEPALHAASVALGARALEREIYVRGENIVRVSQIDRSSEMPIRGEAPQGIKALPFSTLGVHLGAVARWVSYRAGEPVRVRPPSHIVQAFGELGSWPELPVLEGLAYGPTIRPDGSVWDGRGYDALTGLRGVDGWTPEYVPLDNARDRLWDILDEFCWTSSLDLAGWLALVFTGIARYAFSGPSPLFLIDANVPGCGKTKLATMASYIVTGRGCSRGSGMGKDAEEDRKKITSLARRGARMILVDNVKGHWGTGIMEEVTTLTDGLWSDRVLSTNDYYMGPLQAVWVVTANNARLRGDLYRRTCYIRLEGPEDPAARRFRIHDVESETLVRRRSLYDACLSILRAWAESGRDTSALVPWGSYESWSSWVRGAVVSMGLPDPYESQAAVAAAGDAGSVRDLVHGVAGVIRDLGGSASPGQIAEAVWSTQALVSGRYEDARTALVELHPKNRDPQSAADVGRVLASYRGRVVDGVALRTKSRTSRVWVVRDET